MKIKILYDPNCPSKSTIDKMISKLLEERKDISISTIPLTQLRYYKKRFDIKLLPAWIINDESININPFDYKALLKHVTKLLF